MSALLLKIYFIMVVALGVVRIFPNSNKQNLWTVLGTAFKLCAVMAECVFIFIFQMVTKLRNSIKNQFPLSNVAR